MSRLAAGSMPAAKFTIPGNILPVRGPDGPKADSVSVGESVLPANVFWQSRMSARLRQQVRMTAPLRQQA